MSEAPTTLSPSFAALLMRSPESPSVACKAWKDRAVEGPQERLPQPGIKSGEIGKVGGTRPPRRYIPAWRPKLNIPGWIIKQIDG